MKYLYFSLLSLLIFSCKSDDDKLKLNFQLEYDSNPLVMFEPVDYPGGNKILISKVSFYISALSILHDDNPSGATFDVKDVDYIDLTNAHADLKSAEEGLAVEYDLPTTNIDQVFMIVGLNSNLNATVPTDYSSSNDLSLAGEYWPGWESYIFAKIEGMIDLDGDGTLEQQVALHLGSNEARREIITTNLDNETELNISIDIKKVFEHDGEIYDIATTPQIHTINEANAIESINFLADGLIRAFEIKR